MPIEFRKFCNGMFQCKEMMITSTNITPAQRILLKTLDQNPVGSLVQIYSTSSDETKVVKSRITVEEAYTSLTRSGETKPVYVTSKLASLLGIKEGWVLVVVGTEDAVKRTKSKRIVNFSIRIIVMQL